MSQDQYWRASIYTTMRCNLRCPRCLERGLEIQQQPDLTWDAYERFVRGLCIQSATIKWITFTGGEPTLWEPLLDALDFARRMGFKTRVFSNGLHRSAADYGCADQVHITHYGSINGIDRLRLKRQLGSRLKIVRTIQIDVPLPDGGDASLPARCACPGVVLCGERAYPCSGLAKLNDPSLGFDMAMPIWLYEIQKIDPRNSPTCRTCLANDKIRRRASPPLTLEGGLWESTRGFLWPMPWQFTWLRRANRWLFKKKMQK